MGRFVSASDTKAVQADWWEDWEEVTIRKWSISQRDALNEQIVRITGSSASEAVTDMQIKAAQVPVLQAGIKGWTFTEDGEKDGKRVPVSPHWIEQLAPADADFIAAEIWAFNRRPDKEEQESFPAEGVSGGAGEAADVAA